MLASTAARGFDKMLRMEFRCSESVCMLPLSCAVSALSSHTERPPVWTHQQAEQSIVQSIFSQAAEHTAAERPSGIQSPASEATQKYEVAQSFALYCHSD